ncbi:SAM-dependent methyltransferase [Anaerotaenia torta]|uniref:class I SAM-dependent methyltransferase n=1 Tax=Anaerotaenia torta TaxID=433293 RepID=UPI003D22AF24
MKQNKYDDKVFFEKYSKMDRSTKGLAGAGEWKTLEAMLPGFKDKRVLDLGCGFGWHCQYAAEHGAKAITGVDISEKMLAVAEEKTDKKISYMRMPIEEITFQKDSFDTVISSLAFHYIEDFGQIVERVSGCLVSGGDFVFSVEHPVFTAYGSQNWYYDENGNILHFPVDRYFFEGSRTAEFLGEEVIKYHRTLTTYLNGLIQGGFEVTGVVEPQPSAHLLQTVEGMADELRRPMMLIISAKKK